ncbi:MAG: type II toxin-antitoxin system VapC family toxin [Flavobacteriia bacterium]
MKHIFLDTNIVLDVLANRKPFSDSASELFEKAQREKVKLYISSLSYNKIYYILNKQISHKATIAILKDLEELIETLDVSSKEIKKSLYSEFSDFEDAIQYYSALSNKKIDVIITRNPKDFKKSELLVMTPEEALSF